MTYNYNQMQKMATQNGNLDELFGIDLLPQQDKSVKHYKQVIPISLHHFYLVEEIKEVNYYLNMINTIRTAEPHDTIFIYLNTPGGNMHTAIQIISAMRQSSATIVTCLEGVVCSAGTMIFLAGTKHIVNQNCTFMIHNYSQWVGGKGNDVTIQVEYTKSFFKKLCDDIYGKFLSKEEIDSVLSGKDIWMESDEVASRVKDKLISQEVPEDVGNILASLNSELELVTKESEPEPTPEKEPAKKKPVAKKKKS